MDRRERIARAIWRVKPDCHGKPWPVETDRERRAYPHNPIASVDLCYMYADAAIKSDAEADLNEHRLVKK